jgi:hypothetical protein
MKLANSLGEQSLRIEQWMNVFIFYISFMLSHYSYGKLKLERKVSVLYSHPIIGGERTLCPAMC